MSKIKGKSSVDIETTTTRASSHVERIETAPLLGCFGSQGSSTRNGSNSSGGGKTACGRAVWAGRTLFIACLCVVAAVLGYLAYHILAESEEELAERQYEAITDRALVSARESTVRKRLGTVSMASVAANVNPNATNWPFVTIEGYETVSTNLISTSSGREMGFVPLVTPDNLQEFEDFAYDYYENKRLPTFPNGTATSSFGKGIWFVNPELNSEDNRYHVTDGTTTYDSKYDIITPILHHNEGPHKALLINLHSDATRGKLIDQMLDCAKQHAIEPDTECSGITDFIFLTSQNKETGPGALIMLPIYPAWNSDKITGFIASSIVFDEVLVNVFSVEVSGLDCVLSTANQVYTYHIKNGVVSGWEEGDLHDHTYDKYKKAISLTGGGIFSNYSEDYTLVLYPSKAYFETYQTRNPTVATIGAVCIIIFTSLLFFLYDFFVRREFSAKRDLLEAKRKFVRFISHEVRTPLNTVCMGLTLMQEDIKSAMKSGNSKKDDDLVATRVRVADWLNLSEETLTSTLAAVDVLNDTLNYDKIAVGMLSLERTVISIWRLVEHTTDEFRLPALKKKINFRLCFQDPSSEDSETFYTKAASLPREMTDNRVVGDVVRITQVLRNLISNALKFTPENGKVTVTAVFLAPATAKTETTRFSMANGDKQSFERSGTLKVSVADSGAGLSADQLREMFKDGVQFNVNALQAGNGSGLGLHIAKGIVEQHGGALTVASDGLGCGTTFTLTLPLFNAPDPATESTNEEHSDEVGSFYRLPTECMSSLRVLVTDDALMNRKLVVRWLEMHGHTCVEAENGEIAVDRVKESLESGNRFDSILCDYEMPVMNGPTAVKKMRALGCDSFIVGITGNLLPEDVSHFRSCGANTVLPKPFHMPDLEHLWAEYHITGGNSEFEKASSESNSIKV